MSEQFYQHVSRFVQLSRDDFSAISSFFNPLTVKKKENLVTEGQFCRANYFVVKGCLRMFFLDEDGTEQTIQFAIENWWMTDLEAFKNGRKASFSVQAIENTEVLAIDKKEMDKMLAGFPVMEKYFRQVYERAYAASLLRVRFIFRLSKEQFYNHFVSSYPEFIQRIPQKILASFLGFTPEYLSELRKKQLAGKK